MLIAAGPAHARRHAHHQAIRRFECRPIGAHVLGAGCGIAGDDVGRGQRRRAVKAWRRNRNRQPVEAVAFTLQRIAFQHDLMAGRGCHEPWRHRVCDRVVPFGRDVLDRRVHADRVDRAVGRDRADHDRHVVGAATAVDNIGEQKRLAVGLIEPTDELPAHQRMQFGILVDHTIDGEQQALLAQRVKMLVQIAIAARRPGNRARALDVSGLASGHSPLPSSGGAPSLARFARDLPQRGEVNLWHRRAPTSPLPVGDGRIAKRSG